VYRVLSKHYRPAPGGTGPSWLSFIRNTKDSLWSVDFFRCESIVLRSYWVLVVMDQFTRRLVGFGVHCGAVTGADVCRMFNAAIYGQGYRDIPVPITIPCSRRIAGERTCGFSRLTKSKRSRTRRCHTRLSSG
jgi:transposase InsO family protein